jgi:hypothetical protein
MHISMRVLTGAAATAILGLSAWAPAQADPVNAKNSFMLEVQCDNGGQYTVTANGNGNFAPAHDLGSTTTLVPIAFSDQSVTITDPEGTVVDAESLPDSAKPGAAMHNKNATVTCTFDGGATAPDGSTFEISGTVVGFVTT